MLQFVHVNEITMHYQEIGAPDGRPTLVFVNSLGTDFRIWRDVVVRLAGEARIITYDKRGHGLSGIGNAPYAMSDHIADLAGLLDHLQIQNAVICGVSVGGMIALGLADSRPDLVSKLVLCDTAHKIGTPDFWNERIARIEAEGIGGMAASILERWFTPSFRAPDNADFAGYRHMLERQPLAGYTGTCAALRDADLTAAALKLAVPALCLVGDQDGSTPPDLVKSMADLIPGSKFEIINDAGHLPSIEQPEILAGLVKQFLAAAAQEEI